MYYNALFFPCLFHGIFFHKFSISVFCRSSFSDFAQKHGRDERFKNVEKMRERESLFNEYLLEVRKREKEEKTAKREQVFLFFTNIIENLQCVEQCRKYFSGCAL